MSVNETSADAGSIRKVPDYEVSELAFVLSDPRLSTKREEAFKGLMERIKAQQMAPYYAYLHSTGVVSDSDFDSKLLSDLEALNEAEVMSLKEHIAELEEQDEGALEQAEAWIKLGEYYAQIGAREDAEHALQEAQTRAVSTGAKIDTLLTIVRLGFFYNDQYYVQQRLEQARTLVERGGDWERRNRYKTYRGIHCLAIRNFKEAAELLVDSLATFTCTELISYSDLATYASITGLFSLQRTDLKQKIVDSPELLSLMATTDALQTISDLTISLYASDYANYFPHLLETYDKVLLPSKYLNKHADYFVREMRRKVYAQLLDSYKTLSLKSMASAFGVSEDFLDNDLGKFIPNKQLNCVIDKVNGIVETNRPDNKNSQYQLLIKQGDGLLTKLQKYGAVVKLAGSDRAMN